jgi:hypothetical protein
LDLVSLFNEDANINNLGVSTYKGLTDSIMSEIQHTYDLSPREKNSINTPPKNILSQNKANEAVVAKPSDETQVARAKKVKTKVV